MIQTRNMKQNNITMNDIQTRDFHIKIYENLKRLPCPRSWTTLVARDAKQKINYIFNYFKKDTDLLPSWGSSNVHNWRFVTSTICADVVQPAFYPGGVTIRRKCPVSLIICRYEIKRNKIKQEIRRDCISCSDAW